MVMANYASPLSPWYGGTGVRIGGCKLKVDYFRTARSYGAPEIEPVSRRDHYHPGADCSLKLACIYTYHYFVIASIENGLLYCRWEAQVERR